MGSSSLAQKMKKIYTEGAECEGMEKRKQIPRFARNDNVVLRPGDSEARRLGLCGGADM